MTAVTDWIRAHKAWSAVIGIAVVLFVIGLTAGGSTESPTAPDAQQAEPSSPPATHHSPRQASGWPSPAIPGANPYDFTAGLEQTWGLHFSTHSADHPPGLVKDAERRDPDTGATLSASITEDMFVKVRLAECSVTGTDMAVAGSFLRFCASLPYRHAHPAAAARWVVSNVNRVRQGHPLHLKINGARFTLAGSQYARFLQIDGVTVGPAA